MCVASHARSQTCKARLHRKHLQSVEEVVADDDDRGPSGGPALGGRDGLNAGDRGGGVQAWIQR